MNTFVQTRWRNALDAAKSVGRHQVRDAVLILMMFRHGLRVNEAVELRWTDIDWQTAHIYIKRLKRGSPSVQPIDGREMRLLRQLERTQGKERSPWLFISERKSPLTDHSIRKIIARAGELAGFDFPIHPHMLRHSCGYYLARARLGHPTHPRLSRSQTNSTHCQIHTVGSWPL